MSCRWKRWIKQAGEVAEEVRRQILPGKTIDGDGVTRLDEDARRQRRREREPEGLIDRVPVLDVDVVEEPRHAARDDEMRGLVRAAGIGVVLEILLVGEVPRIRAVFDRRADGLADAADERRGRPEGRRGGEELLRGRRRDGLGRGRSLRGFRRLLRILFHDAELEASAARPGIGVFEVDEAERIVVGGPGQRHTAAAARPRKTAGTRRPSARPERRGARSKSDGHPRGRVRGRSSFAGIRAIASSGSERRRIIYESNPIAMMRRARPDPAPA